MGHNQDEERKVAGWGRFLPSKNLQDSQDLKPRKRQELEEKEQGSLQKQEIPYVGKSEEKVEEQGVRRRMKEVVEREGQETSRKREEREQEAGWGQEKKGQPVVGEQNEKRIKRGGSSASRGVRDLPRKDFLLLRENRG